MVIAVGGEVHPFTPWGGKIWKIVKIITKSRHGKNKITNGNGAIIALTTVKRNEKHGRTASGANIVKKLSKSHHGRAGRIDC
jgi:hypothetical protein